MIPIQDVSQSTPHNMPQIDNAWGFRYSLSHFRDEVIPRSDNLFTAPHSSLDDESHATNRAAVVDLLSEAISNCQGVDR